MRGFFFASKIRLNRFCSCGILCPANHKIGEHTLDIIKQISEEMNLNPTYVSNVVQLIDEGNTIPFIARYRKEMHGTMDDTTLRTLNERLEYLRSLEDRRETIKKSITEQGKMTEELEEAIENAKTLASLEDLYLPYKQKRRTRATVAKEKGLEPLALLLYAQAADCPSPDAAAAEYIDEEKGVNTIEEALQGASDIIAEMISDSADVRGMLRDYINATAIIKSSAAVEEDSVYSQYYDFSQPVSHIPGHRILAINRGEKEGFLKVGIEADRETALQKLRRSVIVPGSASMTFVRDAADDAYDRLIFPSLERECRSALTDMACEGAIKMFGQNLKPLLMQPPVKGKVTMGLDPGYRNGCKVAVVDGTGKVLDTAVVYPTFSEAKKEDAISKLTAMIKKNKVEHIAIGNGTASRETEQMTCEMLRRIGGGQAYAIVNEAGASVYSASPLAAAEFPDYDVNLRSAVSIARRLQDPLAELVKIEPKAIGVGQYQHDMPQKQLETVLDGVVEDCVNSVGVDINTASTSLLQRVSGLTKTTAANIVSYREENGIFTSRAQIKKVPKLGPKAFEQCAGFLRVPESKQILDSTGVHPESYKAAEALLEICGYSLEDVKNGNIKELRSKFESAGPENISSACGGTGIPTLIDIVNELLKPGRDPRDELPPVLLRQDVLDIKDIKPGMEMTGTVRNVIDFGAFVDIGVHQDGLVHISQISNKFIKHPGDVLSVGDVVKVKVLDVDEKKGRISLTMKL